jgi:transglutaminase-like putative cysteine protease
MQMIDSEEKYLLPTDMLNFNHPSVKEFTERALESSASDNAVSHAVALYYAVRDGIWYDPYCPFYLPEHYRASFIIETGRGYCVCKAALLCAVARASGIPARLGFADVRNHLATRQLIEFLGSDLFVFHGFTELYLNGKWVIATPAFNIELCRRHQVPPLEFNGQEDSIFQAFNSRKKKFMEYVRYHGSYADVPVDAIVTAWKKTYGEKRVLKWIQEYEKSKRGDRDFYQEDII